MFKGRGGYRRFKVFLESKGMLETWYEFENQREERAMREWCRENEVEIVEASREDASK
jgi:hypothetical protein